MWTEKDWEEEKDINYQCKKLSVCPDRKLLIKDFVHLQSITRCHNEWEIMYKRKPMYNRTRRPTAGIWVKHKRIEKTNEKKKVFPSFEKDRYRDVITRISKRDDGIAYKIPY